MDKQDIRVIGTNSEGRQVVKYLPPSIAYNAEFMKRKGFVLAEVTATLSTAPPVVLEMDVTAQVEGSVQTNTGSALLPSDPYEGKTLDELKVICKEKGIRIRGTVKKETLINKLKNL